LARRLAALVRRSKADNENVKSQISQRLASNEPL